MNFPVEFSEETKKQVALWRDIIQNKHRDDGDEIFCNDPLLIIEYNQPGLAVRNITENDVSAVIRGTPNYIPIVFPRADLVQSNSVFAFNDMQTMEDAIARLFDNYNNFVTGRQDPIVGRVYWVQFRRDNTFEVCERGHVFN
ncbi:14094_t:CDS:2 [Acaulospora morrowiae]|uniref:14094_t:CDS:1 n=1 Tax=Acaulospora morrowiae TaxID=94023 RepID=A0A9N9AW51_9GLOM|nr:14094_t:CDS:2 [Acaulospora morrowiae]